MTAADTMTEKAWEISLKSKTKLTLLCLARHSDSDRDGYVMLNQLSTETGMAQQFLIKCLDNLLRQKLIGISPSPARLMEIPDYGMDIPLSFHLNL